GQVTHGLHGATPCRLRSRLSIAARSQALRQFGSVRLFRVQRLCPSYRGRSCAACSYQYRYQSCGQWRLSCRAWWCAPRALRKPLNWLCEPLGAGARPVHPIRVISRRRSNSVAFGAKRTLTEPRLQKAAAGRLDSATGPPQGGGTRFVARDRSSQPLSCDFSDQERDDVALRFFGRLQHLVLLGGQVKLDCFLHDRARLVP